MDAAQTFQNAGPEVFALLGRGAEVRLSRALERLALPAQLVCLETRLGAEGVGQTDFALCLAHPTPGLAKGLAALAKQPFADSSLQSSWQSCWRLLLNWATASEPTWAAVPFLFVAFDLLEESDGLPVPCLSLCSDPAFFMKAVGLPPLRPSSWQWPLQLLHECCSALDADALWDEGATPAEVLLTSVEDLEVRQLSLMAGRQPFAFKFDVTLSRRDVPAFLEANGWSAADARDVINQLSFFSAPHDRIQLNYAVRPSAAASKTLEVELGCTGATDLSAEQRGTLLADLARREVIASSQARALLELARRPLRDDAGACGVSRHWYLKLRLGVGQRPTAKAYIGLKAARTREVRDAAARG
jgi:hypothetical protein